jgi:hypothetical protein
MALAYPSTLAAIVRCPGGFINSTDPARLDLEVIHSL